MKIYLVRHGESEGNKKNVFQNPDILLSSEGIKQAKILAKRLVDLPIDFVYSSNMARAKQTSGIISEVINKKVELWEDIRELIRPSILWGKEVDGTEGKEFRKLMEENYKNPDWKFQDEESYNELRLRAKKVLKHLLAKHRNQNVLLVSHGTMIKMLISTMIFGDNLSPETFWFIRNKLWSKNSGVTVCEYTDKYGWGLLNWNDTAHL